MRFGRAGAAEHKVGVEEHCLHRGGEGSVAAVNPVEEVQALAVAAEDLRRHGDPIPRMEFHQVSDVVLDREVALARGDVGGVRADQLHEPVGREAPRLEVVVRAHVAVVVGPCHGHLPGKCHRQPVPFGGCEGRVVGRDHSARAASGAAERAENADEVVVAEALECADRHVARLRVRLGGDQAHEVVVELGDIGQPRPGPFEAGPELGHEMLHPRLAARDAIGLEQPICAQRRPKPMRIASSISSVVAIPSFTSQSASRQTDSRRRSAIWASISLRRVRGTCRGRAGRSAARAQVAASPTSSTAAGGRPG
jgi:hypothetical protein